MLKPKRIKPPTSGRKRVSPGEESVRYQLIVPRSLRDELDQRGPEWTRAVLSEAIKGGF